MGGGGYSVLGAIFAGIILWLSLMLYMFKALGTICDEYFVPSLEIISEKLQLSNDVAGATFMAAGGSAPELFTSFIGTFQKSDVGFGTIVGSATFNVLFVIGVCAVASTEVLQLTWWPLFRDCCYYAMTLVVLALFFGGSWSKMEIEPWEAAILLALYLGYVILMKNNQKIYSMLIDKNGAAGNVKLDRASNATSATSVVPFNDGSVEHVDSLFVKPSTFRAGIMQLLVQNEDIVETAGIAAVSKVRGNMRETFDAIDKDQSGFIESHELGELLELMGLDPHSDNVNEAMKNVDRTGDGKISFEEFAKWYTSSEARVEIKMRRMFDKFDTDKTNHISCKEMSLLLKSLGHRVTDDEVVTTVQSISRSKTNVITYDEFAQYYQHSLFWDKQLEHMKMEQKVEESNEEGLSLDFPYGARTRSIVWYMITYPICSLLYITMPDVRRSGCQTSKLATIQFAMSIFWIGVYSFLMVEWVTLCSNTVGLPVPVAGVTLLAAGTSVPDMLSSYIVARQGEGDMAVSSSIGSNIFDVTVGLPLPWLCYTLYYGENVKVNAKSLPFSVMVLLLMLVLVVAMIKINNWKMTKCMGYTMFCLYGIFILQDLLQQLPAGDPTIKTPEF